MKNSSNMNVASNSLFLESAESDRDSFEIEGANSMGHDVYAPRSREVYLIGNFASGWQITKPLSLMIDENPNGSYISDSEFHVYGYGKTKTEALKDYSNSLVEYYQILASKDDGPTQALLSRLRSFLLSTSSRA